MHSVTMKRKINDALKEREVYTIRLSYRTLWDCQKCRSNERWAIHLSDIEKNTYGCLDCGYIEKYVSDHFDFSIVRLLFHMGDY